MKKSTPVVRYSVVFIPLGTSFLLLCTALYLAVAPSGQNDLDPASGSFVSLLSLNMILTLAATVGSVYLARRETVLQANTKGELDSERQFRVLLHSAPDAIVVVDDSGVVRVVNQAAMDLFGYSEQEFAERSVEQLLPDRYRDHHVEYRRGYMGNPTVRPMGQSKELYAQHKNGREIPVEISLSPLRRDDGTWVTAIIRDVSVQREHLRQINTLNQQLESRWTELEAINKELEAFSYSVSHDLRAPLRAIDGFSHTVLRLYQDKLDEKGQDRLQRIRAAAQNMGKLIDDLLVLSRITRADVKVEEIDISALVENTFRGLQEDHPDRNVSLQVEPEMIGVADARLISVALTNLLSNAWKFTSHRDNATIEVFTEAQEGKTIYAVRDNGAGFNMDYADKLFGAFQRLHDAKEFPGTGIGLATVQRVIHKHGGRVWAIAQEGVGATFYFSLSEDEAS